MALSGTALSVSRLACACVLTGGLALAQVPTGVRKLANPLLARLICDDATRIADPKLEGGEVRLSFRLIPAFTSVPAVAEVRSGGALVKTLWSGTLVGGAAPTQLTWDGRDASGARCSIGAYTLRVAGMGVKPLAMPLDLVRLGITEIEAQDSPAAGTDEFQMVYFMKGATYAFYATPAIHEYVAVARPGQVSDLDLDDGEPRPVVPVHVGTASPRLDGAAYETFEHNYPLAYLMGASPRLELTFGASATSAAQTSMGVGYPLAGHEIRVVCDQGLAVAGADEVVPGGTALVDLAALAAEVGRQELSATFRWEFRAVGDGFWSAIPGSQTIPLRFYTLLGTPQFKSGASGTQYSGPWVEVAEYIATWKDTLGLGAADQLGLTEVHIKGFFGQNGGIPTAIEDVVYDAFPLGGDGGATHYHSFPTWNMNLSRLLNGHASGRYVNCSDNMGASTTMLSMMGATNVRSVRLGSMDLRALWGIGAPGYTLDLWGGSHGFSYHHIITDDGAVSVSDSCMQLDEDGNPTALPSFPGWNVRRLWTGVMGYMNLAADNVVSRTVEALPGLN
jgi:hypothetical protein